MEGEPITAHRILLTTRSKYFYALLFGGLKESKLQEIDLSIDTPLATFPQILQYVYTGPMKFANLTDDNILKLLGLANKRFPVAKRISS